MTLALTQALQPLHSALSPLIARVRDKAGQLSKPLAALWMAFMLGLLAANLWFSLGRTEVLPSAQVQISPIPLPWLAGTDPIDRPLPTAAASSSVPAYRAYAYPFDRTDARPRISLIILEAGLQHGLLQQALEKLPGSIGVAFSPYTPKLEQALASARTAGHEVLLMIPADDPAQPQFDPGPAALRHTLTAGDNLQRFRQLLATAPQIIGVVADPLSPILETANLAQGLLSEARTGGFAMLSLSESFTLAGQKASAPVQQITSFLNSPDPQGLPRWLQEAEQRGRETGHVILAVTLYPYMINDLALWLQGLADKGLALAPVSSAFSDTPTP